MMKTLILLLLFLMNFCIRANESIDLKGYATLQEYRKAVNAEIKKAYEMTRAPTRSRGSKISEEEQIQLYQNAIDYLTQLESKFIDKDSCHKIQVKKRQFTNRIESSKQRLPNRQGLEKKEKVIKTKVQLNIEFRKRINSLSKIKYKNSEEEIKKCEEAIFKLENLKNEIPNNEYHSLLEKQINEKIKSLGSRIQRSTKSIEKKKEKEKEQRKRKENMEKKRIKENNEKWKKIFLDIHLKNLFSTDQIFDEQSNKCLQFKKSIYTFSSSMFNWRIHKDALDVFKFIKNPNYYSMHPLEEETLNIIGSLNKFVQEILKITKDKIIISEYNEKAEKLINVLLKDHDTFRFCKNIKDEAFQYVKDLYKIMAGYKLAVKYKTEKIKFNEIYLNTFINLEKRTITGVTSIHLKNVEGGGISFTTDKDIQFKRVTLMFKNGEWVKYIYEQEIAKFKENKFFK